MTTDLQEEDFSPAFILVRPQLAENIGSAARAMMNCALTDMRLVDPDDDHLCSRALATASGADECSRQSRRQSKICIKFMRRRDVLAI